MTLNELKSKAIGHIAHPDNVPITKENQIVEYGSYFHCPDYNMKIRFHNPDIGLNPFDSKAALCTSDCLFPTCPFYDFWTINNKFNPYNNHLSDYDEWVVEEYNR